jgi:hypothetical protein
VDDADEHILNAMRLSRGQESPYSGFLDMLTAAGTKAYLGASQWPERVKESVTQPMQDVVTAGDMATGKLPYDQDAAIQAATRLAGNVTLGSGAMEAPEGALMAGAARSRAPYERKVSPLGLYSAGAEHAYNLPQETGSVAQMRAMLEKSGTKPAEFEWSGFDRAFPDPKAKVTRDDLVRHFESNVPQLNESVLANPLKDDVHAQRIEPIGDHGLKYLNTPQDVALARTHNKNFDLSTRGMSDDEVLSAAERLRRYKDYGDPKFEKYTLPGGSDYRESLLHLMPSTEGAAGMTVDSIANRLGYGGWHAGLTPEQQAHVNAAWEAQPYGPGAGPRVEPTAPLYKSSHWDVPNVVAHTRASTRELPGGGKAYHLEESQSDWGQEARKKGLRDIEAEAAARREHEAATADLRAAHSALLPKYHAWEDAQYDSYMRDPTRLRMTPEEAADLKASVLKDRERMPVERQTDLMNQFFRNAEPPTRELFKDDLAAIRAAEQRREAATQAGIQASGGLPNAPYIGSTQGWTDLNLKRALYEAAQGGHDRFAWTPGVEQAGRYDLSKQVKEVRYHPEHKQFAAIPHQGDEWITQNGVEPEDLEKFVGKDVAKKLLETEPVVPEFYRNRYHTLSGLDLSVGGEGMKSYYDKMLPSRLKEVLKQIERNPKFEPVEVGVPRGKPTQYADFDEWSATPENQSKQIPALALTPEMREKILKGGFPYFMRGGTVDDHVHAAMRVAKGY